MKSSVVYSSALALLLVSCSSSKRLTVKENTAINQSETTYVRETITLPFVSALDLPLDTSDQYLAPKSYTLQSGKTKISAEVQGNRLKLTAGENITSFIKVGDPVEIKLGYDDELHTEFKGYVSKISADAPLVIHAQDEMYRLKQSHFVRSFTSAHLKEVIAYIAPGYKHDMIDNIHLGSFVVDNASAYEVLEHLKTDYGLFSYFKEDKTLHVGFAFDIAPGLTHELHLGKNVRNLSHGDLEFSFKEDTKLIIRVSSKAKGEKKAKKAEFGKKGGKVKNMRLPGGLSDQSLKNIAKKNYESLRYEGFKGSVPTWGLPRTQAGEAVHIIEPAFKLRTSDLERAHPKEREGKYLIEEVSIAFNAQNGFVRKNKLGIRLNDKNTKT